MNNVLDWNKLQNYTNVYDSHNQAQNNINFRRISIENATSHTLAIFISDKLTGDKLKPQFFLRPKESQAVAVNAAGCGIEQYIRILGLDKYGNYKEIGQPSSIVSTYNQFVIREGSAGLGRDYGIFVYPYYQASFRA